MGIISLINGIVDSDIDVMLDKADDPVKDIRPNKTNIREPLIYFVHE